MRILLLISAAAAFHGTPPAQHSSHLIRAAKGDLDDDLSPEDMAKFQAQAPSDSEQAALFAQLKEQFAAIEGSTYGGARDEDYFEEEDKTLEAELRKAGGRLSKQDQRDVDRAALEATFERAKEDFKSTVEKMKEDDLAVTNIKRAELEEEMAAEARAFETRMDALAREAGVDPRGPLPEFDEDVIITLDAVLAEPAPVSNIPVSNAVRVCGAKGGALQELVVDELKKLGVEEASVGDAKRGNTGTLVLVDAGEAEAKRLVETARPRRVVVASRQGVTRSGEFAFLFRKGALDGARGVEGAAKLALQKIGEGGESVVVRLGEAKGASGEAVVEVGDTLDEATSTDVAAAALARCCLDARVANATLAVSGADASVDWSDLLLKADGPELLRRPARASENEVLSWVREWATLWTAKGDNARRLTTPVDVVPISNGAELVFVDKRAPKRSKAGGVRLVVEAVDGVRVRAVRGAYSEGIAVKAMSEDLILARLDEDLSRTFG